jgi:predicted outer membrane repeat protein
VLIVPVDPGVRLEQQSAEDNGTLIHFNQSIDVILRDSLLLNINASTLDTIMWFEGLRSVTVEGLTATGCNSLAAVLSIQNCTSKVQVSSSQFSNSTTGAVVLDNNAAIVSHSTFASLAQVKAGVAINVENDDGSPFTVTNCTFKDILAVSSQNQQYYGGAITAFSPQITISQSHFTNCSAWQGGAMKLYSEQLLNGSWPTTLHATIDICMFDSNSANSSGGALCFYGSSGFVSDTMTVTRSTFDNNHAVYGGAVYTEAIGYADVHNCTFHNNMAYQGVGGAVYINGLFQRYTNVLLANSAFIHNSVPDSVADGEFDVNALSSLSFQTSCSGALLSSCYCIGIWNCTFLNNFGSGLCLDNTAGLCNRPHYQSVYPDPLYDILFNTSTLSRQGGSFVKDFTSSSVVSIDVRGSTFINNEAHSFDDSHLFTFENGLKSIGDVRGGGGIFVNLVQYALFADCVFKDNNAIQGGGMYLDGCTAIIIWNSVFDNNTAIGSGGAIASVNSHDTGVLVGASTIQNSWARSGAGFYGGAGSSLTMVDGTSMVNNSATSYGGAIHCVSCQEVTAESGASLASNKAVEAGGACYCDGCVLFQLSNATLLNNRWVLCWLC